jgi:hypothetical protein
MALLKKSPRALRPDNVLGITANGFALWELWYDDGPATLARPVMHGPEPARFLTDEDADVYARKLAKEHPNRRYKPVTR